MSKTKYVDLFGITQLQESVMKVIDKWARENKTPIAHKEILDQMEDQGVKNYNTINAIKALLKKGYIRRAVIISNKSYYVQLRRL